jgi:two-component system, NarL family, sensor histidine kinase DegS
MNNEPFLQENNPEDFENNLQDELEQTLRSIKEISTTLEQSQNEFNRLTQKKANVTAQLQIVQTNGDQISRSDIRNVFTDAMDAQQRLLVMKAQLDRLQEQHEGLIKYKNYLETVKQYISGENLLQSGAKTNANGFSALEMLINAQEAERQKLSRQMHDGPAQALSNFIVQTEIASRMFDIDALKAKEELEKLKTSAMNTFQKVRSYINDLRPMMLDDLGLVPTLKRYIAGLKEQTGIEISESILGGDQKLDPFIEVFVFRAIQELVGNSVKHNMDNASKVKIDVSLSIEPNYVKVTIKDNGKGFDPAELKDSGGLGLKLLQEHTEMLNGIMNIRSSIDKGTEVVIQIPVSDVPVKK